MKIKNLIGNTAGALLLPALVLAAGIVSGPIGWGLLAGWGVIGLGIAISQSRKQTDESAGASFFRGLGSSIVSGVCFVGAVACFSIGVFEFTLTQNLEGTAKLAQGMLDGVGMVLKGTLNVLSNAFLWTNWGVTSSASSRAEKDSKTDAPVDKKLSSTRGLAQQGGLQLHSNMHHTTPPPASRANALASSVAETSGHRQTGPKESAPPRPGKRP